MIDQNLRIRPYLSIKATLALLEYLGGGVIVEIGSMRQDLPHPIDEFHHGCCNDGHSSVLFARSGYPFYTVDINEGTWENVRRHTSQYPNAHCFHGDGIEFLQSFDRLIDLLYLDAWDANYPDSAQNHLEAFKIAQDKMATKSMVLIDDTDVCLEDGELVLTDKVISGKGELVIPYAELNGWKIKFSGRQTLLTKGV